MSDQQIVPTGRVLDHIPDILDEPCQEYTREFMKATEKSFLDDVLRDKGYLSLDQIRDLIEREGKHIDVENSSGFDAEIIMIIDRNFHDKVFIVGGELFTRDALYEKFDLRSYAIIAESLFHQQVITEFIYSNRREGTRCIEYVAHDAETYCGATYNDAGEMIDPESFGICLPSECMLDVEERTLPSRVVKSKVFIARKKWDEFQNMRKLMGAFQKTAEDQYHVEKLLQLQPPEVRLALTGSDKPGGGAMVKFIQALNMSIQGEVSGMLGGVDQRLAIEAGQEKLHEMERKLKDMEEKLAKI